MYHHVHGEYEYIMYVLSLRTRPAISQQGSEGNASPISSSESQACWKLRYIASNVDNGRLASNCTANRGLTGANAAAPVRAKLVMSGAAAGKLRHLVRAAPQVLKQGDLPQTLITSDATDMTPHVGHPSSPECLNARTQPSRAFLQSPSSPVVCFSSCCMSVHL